MFTAHLFRRWMAVLWDFFFICILLMPFWLRVGIQFVETGEIYLDLKWVVLACFLVFSYKVLFLKFYGATPGKLLLGVKVISVDTDQKDLSWGQASLRACLEFFSLFFSWALYVTALARMDRRHVIDLVAETRVVQKKGTQKVPHTSRGLAILFLVFFLYHGAETWAFVSPWIVIEDGALEVLDFWSPFIEEGISQYWPHHWPWPNKRIFHR